MKFFHPLHPLVVALAALLPLSCSSALAFLRKAAEDPAEGGPAPAPVPAPAPAPGPSPGPEGKFEPGTVVRLESDVQELMANFETVPVRYDPLMEDMAGKDFVIKETSTVEAVMAAAGPAPPPAPAPAPGPAPGPGAWKAIDPKDAGKKEKGKKDAKPSSFYLGGGEASFDLASGTSSGSSSGRRRRRRRKEGAAGAQAAPPAPAPAPAPGGGLMVGLASPDGGGLMVGLASPDGSQNGVWWFPPSAFKLWADTSDAHRAPARQLGAKALGTPSHVRWDVMPPSRHGAPWDWQVQGRHLFDPIAPHAGEHVDLKKTSVPLPPWRKVQEIVSVECLEKVHADPTYVCNQTAYKNYAAVAPPPTKAPLVNSQEAESMKRKIRHLKAQIKHMKEPCLDHGKIVDAVIHPGFAHSKHGMPDAAKWQERVTPHRNPGKDPLGQQMHIGRLPQEDVGLTSAQGVAEAKAKKLAR